MQHLNCFLCTPAGARSRSDVVCETSCFALLAARLVAGFANGFLVIAMSLSSPLLAVAEEGKPFELFNAQQRKAPTYISAERLTVDNNKRTFSYEGGVEVIQDDMILVSDSLSGNYSEKREIQRMVALGNVMVTKGETIRASGNRADYDATRGTLVLSESPELQQNGSILSADRVTIYIQQNRSEAEGNVRVKMAERPSTGRR